MAMGGQGVSGGGGGKSILDVAKTAVGKTLSPIGAALNAPQQGLYHAITGIKDLATGKPGAALGELGNVGREAIAAAPGVGQLGQAIHKNPVTTPAPDISFTNLIGAKKLFPGGETIGKIATDPLTYLTFGLGGEAKAGEEALRVAGEHGLADTIRAGGMKTLSQAEKQTVKDALIANAKDVPAAQAEKVAQSQMKALASRGGGGLGARIPGTDIGAHIGGSFDPMEGLSKLGDKFPRVGAALQPGNEAAFKVGATDAAKDVSQQGNKLSHIMRSQMLAFPGTVGNRLRRGITMNLLDEITPTRQLKLLREGRALTEAGGAAEKAVGLDSKLLDTDIHTIMEKSQKDVAKNLKKGVGQGGLFPVHPMSYKEALEQVLSKKNITMPMYKAELARAGVDADKFINLRQIMATSGHNLYEEGAKAAPQILKSGPVHEASDFLKEHYTEPIKRAGTKVENANRMVSALHNLEKFGNVEQAASHVKAIVGDPWNLSAAEQFVKPVSPFVGSIRSHATGVAQAALNNPAPFSALKHTLGNTAFASGSGNPVESATTVGDALPNLLTNPKVGLDQVGNMTGGPIASAFRLMNNAHAMPDSRSGQLKKIATEVSPFLSRIPFHGKKGSLLQQVERFIAGTATR